MRPRLLVLGVGGQVGRALSEAAPDRVLGLTHAELDICNETTVAEAIRRFRPNTIINAAAFTAVDHAETESGEAFRVNRDGARVVALAAAAADIPLIHLSTDYVFDGQSRVPYTESDPVRPISVYGRSKEEGERAVRDVSHKHVILRSAWVYSPYGTNFVRTMLRLGSERSELRIVDDQTGCPTAAADIATASSNDRRCSREAGLQRLGNIPLRGCRRRHLVWLCQADLRHGQKVWPTGAKAPPDQHRGLPHGRATSSLFCVKHREAGTHLRNQAAAVA